MAEAAKTPPSTARGSEDPQPRRLTTEELVEKAKRFMDRYPKIMAKLAE